LKATVGRNDTSSLTKEASASGRGKLLKGLTEGTGKLSPFKKLSLVNPERN